MLPTTPEPEDCAAAPAAAPAPGHRPPGSARLRELALGAAILAGPLAFFVGAVLTPSVHEPGAQAIAHYAAADPAVDAAHLVGFVLAGYLLPVSAVGLARLAHPHRPRAATIAGVVAVLGWLPLPALTALDDLGSQLARSPGATSSADLLDRFSTDPVMNGYLIVYALGHLAGYLLLGIVLHRSRVVPRWSAMCLVLSSPLTLAVFFVPGRPLLLGEVALGLVVVGSLPAAWTTGRAAFRSPRPVAPGTSRLSAPARAASAPARR